MWLNLLPTSRTLAWHLEFSVAPEWIWRSGGCCRTDTEDTNLVFVSKIRTPYNRIYYQVTEFLYYVSTLHEARTRFGPQAAAVRWVLTIRTWFLSLKFKKDTKEFTAKLQNFSTTTRTARALKAQRPYWRQQPYLQVCYKFRFCF